MRTIEPLPQFTGLSESEVLEALEDPDGANVICHEVARLIAGYSANFEEYVRKLGFMPTTVLNARPGSPIEAVALDLTRRAIKESLAAQS